MDLSRFLEAARTGCVDPWQASRYAKDSPDPPPAPDYRGAAQETSAGNLENARYATKANRVNQYSPYGSQTYTPWQNGDPDSWRQDITLSPTGQQLFDTANQSALGLAGQQGQALQRTQAGLAQPFDYGSVGELADASYGAQTARLDPQWDERAEQQRTMLANQGLAPGGEAYDAAQRNFGQQRNDAYQQARLAAQATMPQNFQLAQALRSQPLNELNALRTGSQVQNPTFNQVPMQQATPGANYLGAAQMGYGAGNDAYNSSVGSDNALMSGLFSIGGSMLGGPIGGMIGSQIGKRIG